jgi:hypothetical protein
VIAAGVVIGAVEVVLGDLVSRRWRSAATSRASVIRDDACGTADRADARARPLLD